MKQILGMVTNKTKTKILIEKSITNIVNEKSKKKHFENCMYALSGC